MTKIRVSAEQRRAVIARSGDCCEYCRSQSEYGTEDFSVEHIVPRQKGGKTTLNNLALACQGCNGHKYTKLEAPDPETGQPAPLYHPRQHKWAEHFEWSEDFTQIKGITPTGRATVVALDLNRRKLRNLRGVLRHAGKHPPPDPE